MVSLERIQNKIMEPKWKSYEAYYFDYLPYNVVQPNLLGNYMRFNPRLRAPKATSQYAPNYSVTTNRYVSRPNARQESFDRLWSDIIYGYDQRSFGVADQQILQDYPCHHNQ